MDENACVNSCTKCSKLVESRSQIVNGVGDINADLLIVGEAPGENEDIEGEPFVGRSGDILTDSLADNNFERSDVRITNIVRCRPPENRDPHKDERQNCMSHLEDEISLVDPDCVLTLGKVPSQNLVSDNIKVSEDCGSVHEKMINNTNVKIIVGLHPASTLYNSSYKDDYEAAIRKAIQLTT